MSYKFYYRLIFNNYSKFQSLSSIEFVIVIQEQEMDIKYLKNFRMKLDQFLRAIVEQRFNKQQNQMTSDSLERLVKLTNQCLEASQDVNDQLNERKQILLVSKRIRQFRRQQQFARNQQTHQIL